MYGKRLESLVHRINEIRKHSDLELSELAIRFLDDQSSIDKIIFGVKRKEHVKNILEQEENKLTQTERNLKQVEDKLQQTEDQLIQGVTIYCRVLIFQVK